MTRHGHLATGELLVKRGSAFGETTLPIRRSAGGFSSSGRARKISRPDPGSSTLSTAANSVSR